MSPEEVATTIGGGAVGVIAIYLCKIILELVKNSKQQGKSAHPPPRALAEEKIPTNTRGASLRYSTKEVEMVGQLQRIHSEIENSKKDRAQLLELVRDIHADINNGRTDREHMLRMLRALIEKVKDLHEWHDNRDEDGVLKWWNKKSVEKEINKISRTVEEIRSNGPPSSGSIRTGGSEND